MKRKGLALIAVIVMIVLFTSLILAVVLSATMSIRRANYYKDKLIALEIAETGLQKVLYNMNYVAYDYGYYPFGWSDQSNIQKETEINLGIGKLTIKIDPDNVGADTKILAIGSYRGRIAKISCEIRSDSEIKLGDKLNDNATSETQAIPEAFNKHVIYASQVSGIGTTVKGNITYANTSSIPPGQVTFTQTNNFSIPILSSSYKPKDADFQPPSAISISPTKRFKDADGSPPYAGVSPYETSLPSGVSYTVDTTNLKEIYTISNPSTPISEDWQFEQNDTLKGSGYTLEVRITQTTNLSAGNKIKSGASGDTADIVLDFSGTNNPNIQGKLIAERNININGGTGSKNTVGTSGTTLYSINGSIIIDYTGGSGPVINGDIRSGGDIVLRSGTNKIQINGNVYAGNTVSFDTNSNTTDGIKINGDVIGINGGISFTGNNNGSNSVYSLNSKKSISINGGTNFSLSIDSSSSSKKAGIVLYNDSDITLTLNIQKPITIKIGDNQISGIVLYFDNVTNGGNNKISNISINSNINFDYGFSNNEVAKFAIINQSEKTNGFTINGNIKGLIYSAFYKDTAQQIQLNGGTIDGSIITNGEVVLNGGSLNYASEIYKGKIKYTGFVGGRRKYLPVPGSWKIEW
jgi:hypothetical protein